MNRTTFLISYILLALLSGGAGNNWTLTVAFMRFATMGAAALATPMVVVLLVVPIALIVIARLRGQRIAKPWLVWLPVAALLISILPWVMYPLATRGFGLKNAPIYFTMALTTLSMLAPIVLHTVCATLGGQNSNPSQRSLRT